MAIRTYDFTGKTGVGFSNHSKSYPQASIHVDNLIREIFTNRLVR
jgi:hypothetical protein